MGLACCVGLALLGSRARAGDVAVPRAEGAHVASADVDEHGVELVLKSGFGLLVPAHTLAEPRTLTLRIARERAAAAQIADGFVPIGPTVELGGMLAPDTTALVVTYAADRSRPRSGHRLVLGVERPERCEGTSTHRRCARWELVDAVYDEGRCRARVSDVAGSRMQFGSVPAGGDVAR